MPKVHILDHPRNSQMLDYAINIYKDGKFVKCYRFEGFSGHAASDEAKCLSNEYPASEGYTFSMTL